MTVRQAKEAALILRKWLAEADHKYCYLNAGGKLVPLCYSKNVVSHAKGPVKYVLKAGWWCSVVAVTSLLHMFLRNLRSCDHMNCRNNMPIYEAKNTIAGGKSERCSHQRP